ncbi:uncharacterized protein LOC106663462 isoform X2 [Cimex lectularius]|uniref:Bromo domain-containing protein n=1 Tax=Cimex lectularius TaxID=79782 RepID=A0A8I6TCG2_CIMLE|nr:uncharacterized protein LOC106663462 isoform X2 [Cimex lectularius]
MDDIQSWWEVPSIAHFCSLFRVAFNLLDFDIEELEEALLTDGTELNGSSLLQDLIVRLLSGCLGHNGISTFNYQMFLRRLFRTKCKEQGRENPFNTDIDFQFLPLRTKVEILHTLCDFRLDADDVIDVLKNLDSDSLRVHPLGHDENKSAYWYFYGTRLYKEDYPKKRRRKRDHDKRSKRKRADESSSDDETEEVGSSMGMGTWKVMCYTEEDWQKLADSMAGSTCKEERILYSVLSEDFLPEIPRLFEEKERLQRKRLLENQPRRQSRRLEKLKFQKTEQDTKNKKDRYYDREVVNREKYLQRVKKCREERQKRALGRSKSRSDDDSACREGSSSVLPAGRQTNNSLSSATGAIIIKPSKQKFQASQLFRRTREDLMTGMYKILDRVKADSDSWPFRDPVDEAYAPKYYAVIARPMDLQTMEDKLDNGEYGSLQEFRADFQLIVDNCRQYNGSSNEYTEMAVNMQQLFEASIERYLDLDASSDDELSTFNRNYLEEEEDMDDDSLGSSLTPLMNGPMRSDRSRSLSSISNGTISDQDLQYSDPREKDSLKLGRNKRKVKRKKKLYPDYISSLDEDSMDTSQSPIMQKKKPKRILDKGMKKQQQNKKSAETRDSESKDISSRLNSSRDTSVEDRSKERSETSLERTRPKINYNEQYSSQSDLVSDSSQSDDSFTDKLKNKHANKKPVKRAGVIKNLEALEALEVATEQTLKDINKWLDETPKFSDFSSNSNSPLHTPFPEEMASLEGEYRRRLHMDRPIRPRDRFSNDLHRRRLFKEQMGLKRRREIQRTIDRLQPGKSKGNLLSKENLQDNSNNEPKFQVNIFNDSTPKISLGKVLETDVLGLGIGESPTVVKKDSDDDCTQDKLIIEEDGDFIDEKMSKEEEESKPESEVVLEEKKTEPEPQEQKKEKPTPNLSAWFKAFGAPKAPVNKKKVEQEESKLNERKSKDDDLGEDDKKSHGFDMELPARRQRKASTGSSVSERSSFSQEPADHSPRPSLDEPYLSPQQDISKTYHPSPINGTIKVGFYQDTCFPRGSSEKSGSPRDMPNCSPKELSGASPHPSYHSPRSANISPRDYRNSSPHRPYSPRSQPISPNDYENSPREVLNASPHHYHQDLNNPQEHIVNHLQREYKYRESSQRCREEIPPKNEYPPYNSAPHTSAHVYGGVPSIPSHLSYYDTNKTTENFRNAEKSSVPIYPVKKRAYSEIDNSKSSEQLPVYKSSGGSFTPTREAMEQERTFTPTPGRIPGPSQPLRVSDSIPTMSIHHPLQHHLLDTYAEERHLSSPYFSSDNYAKVQGRSPHPLYPQPTNFSLNHDVPHNLERNKKDEVMNRVMRERSKSPHTSETYNQSPPVLNYTSRSISPLKPPSPSSPLPLNFSNCDNLSKTSVSSSKLTDSRVEEMSGLSYSKVTSGEILQSKRSPSSPISYTTNRLNEMIPPKVSSPYNRAITDLPHGINYNSGQDLSKISLGYSNQSELLAAKMNYNHHQMAELMQTSRYNYPEIMQGKSVYSHTAMQEFINAKGSAYSNMIPTNLTSYNRSIPEIMQGKVTSEIPPREVVYSPRNIPVNKPETVKSKKSRKKKSETVSGFHQYVAPSSAEPISLKTSSVPGSAFNFGPPLKESYGSYLDDIRSPYFTPSTEGGTTKTAPHTTAPYFLGHPPSRASYPHPFMNTQYPQLLHRHPEELLRPMVLHQGLIPPPAGYPPGYIMHDTINRHSWL